MSLRRALAGWAVLGSALSAWGQTTATVPDAASGWQSCAQQTQDAAARLACYDRWVQTQGEGQRATPSPHPQPAETPPQAPEAATPNCRNPRYSALSRYWELEDGSDCGRFMIRGYKPISLSYIHSDTVNRAPSSPTAGHTASAEQPYLINEGRIQLSVRTKIGQGLLPVTNFGGRDSVWFGYTQQSYWQLFTSSISRPFRNTDHEPEIMYIVPMPADLPAGWRLRYGGASLNHQSNGQTLPLSRSWNRAILMAGMEKDDRFTVTARLWNRIPDGDETDDNPDIDNFIGRGEVTGSWQVNPDNTLMLTLRHSMTGTANGSYRFEWLQALGDGNRDGTASGLRLHLQLFNGYGDSLVDYNRGRTVLSIGLSLVDF
jgi:phospholipase A1